MFSFLLISFYNIFVLLYLIYKDAFMKKIPYQFLVRLLLTVLIVFYCSNTYAQIESDNSLVYKVEKNGVSNFYLFGTMHIICENNYQIPPALKEIINQSNTLYLEVVMNEINAMEVMNYAMTKEKMEDYISAETIDSLSKFIAKYSPIPLPWMILSKFQPIYLQQMILEPLLECNTRKMDIELNSTFDAAGKSIKGLETAEFQLKMLSAIEYKDQLEALLNVMRNPSQSITDFNKMMDVYNTGDINQLYSMINGDDSFSKMQHTILSERNKNWVEIIEKNFKEDLVSAQLKTTLYAFGAGHLGGEEGVINLLRKKGFKVTPIK